MHGDHRLGLGHQERAWGWRTIENAIAAEWHAQGPCIGWLDGDDLYLDPESSFAVAQRLAQGQGESLPVTPRTLHKRLHGRGMLVTTDDTRDRLVVRRMIAGVRRSVLHVPVSFLMAE